MRELAAFVIHDQFAPGKGRSYRCTYYYEAEQASLPVEDSPRRSPTYLIEMTSSKVTDLVVSTYGSWAKPVSFHASFTGLFAR